MDNSCKRDLDEGMRNLKQWLCIRCSIVPCTPVYIVVCVWRSSLQSEYEQTQAQEVSEPYRLWPWKELLGDVATVSYMAPLVSVMHSIERQPWRTSMKICTLCRATLTPSPNRWKFIQIWKSLCKRIRVCPWNKAKPQLQSLSWEKPALIVATTTMGGEQLLDGRNHQRSHSHVVQNGRSEEMGMPHDFFKLFLLKFQTPVTLFSGEWWSFLVARLAHSAYLQLRYRLLRVSRSNAWRVAYSTGYCPLVTHPSINLASNPGPRCHRICHRRKADRADPKW